MQSACVKPLLQFGPRRVYAYRTGFLFVECTSHSLVANLGNRLYGVFFNTRLPQNGQNVAISVGRGFRLGDLFLSATGSTIGALPVLKLNLNEVSSSALCSFKASLVFSIHLQATGLSSQQSRSQ